MKPTGSGATVGQNGSPSSTQHDFLGGHSREEAIRLLDQALGDRAQHSPEDLRVIAVVEQHIETTNVRFPRPRKYLVERKGEDWVVTVLDLDDLLRGGRDHELTFRVGWVKGHLSILNR